MATKIIVNGNVEAPRTLNPFAYKDLIKSLEGSNEARVTLDGVTVFRSAVTSGRDVKAYSGMKFHLYFYATQADARVGTAARQWLPLTAAEAAEYRSNPAYVISIERLAAPVAEPVAAEPVAAEPVAAEPVAAEPVAVAEPVKAKGRRARREAVAA
jgi:hypothetical protein